MIFSIKEDSGRIKISEKYYYEWALKKIEDVRKNLEQRNVEERVINALDSVKDFWCSNDFYSKTEECEPYLILEKVLAYFEDTRRTKFSDCDERVQKLLNELREFIIEEKDLEVIKEAGGREDIEKGTIMTAEKFLDNIDYEVKVLEIADRYIGSNHEKEIIRYQFVKDAVKRFGISDSYPAEILLEKMIKSLKRKFEVGEGIPNIVLELEAYRCIVKGSTDTLQTLIKKYGNLE